MGKLPTRFTTDWFTPHIRNWEKYLAEFKDNMNLNFLEIGSYERRSARWLLENILSDKSSTLTCINIFEPLQEEYTDVERSKFGFERAFEQNVSCAFPEQVYTFKGLSYQKLEELPENNYDFVYVDGSHITPITLEDAILSWWLLKSGSIVL